MLGKSLKGQSSVEYLIIVAIALVVLIPGSYLFLNYSKSTSDQVSANQLNLIGRDIINRATEMHILGRDSWVTIEFSLPNNFINGSIHNGTDMYFNVFSSGGLSTIVFFPVGFNISNSDTVPCTGDCPLDFSAGINRVKIQSRGNFVSVVKK